MIAGSLGRWQTGASLSGIRAWAGGRRERKSRAKRKKCQICPFARDRPPITGRPVGQYCHRRSGKVMTVNNAKLIARDRDERRQVASPVPKKSCF